ncbi:hypothetical protein [Pseudomonas sp. TWI929]|uniref:hypothetical protein n=1 Tax=Pseudomonas sp. TWI929 TaxID=3136795 RepID=UPI00320B1F82
MDFEKILTMIQKEWNTISQAPLTFLLLTVAAFSLAYYVSKWRYAGVTENLREQIATLNQRLISKTEQSEGYKERALKFDELSSKVVEYDAEELRTKTINFVARMRAFIERRKNRQYEGMRRRPVATEEERDREWERSTAAMLQDSNDTAAEWDREFKVDAMLLRDELRSRVQVTDQESKDHFYEHPTNFFGYDEVASDLEALAKRLQA